MKAILILPLLFIGINLKAQGYYQLYFNEELQTHVTLNHAYRIMHDKTYKGYYDNENEYYKDINEKLTQIVFIKQQIYNSLKNVNHALKQGKQVEQIVYDFTNLLENMGEMAELSAENPQYSILITRFYKKIYLHAMNAYESVKGQILREETDYLMDSYDRQYLLNRIHREIKIMNGWVLHINNYLRNAKKKPYLRHIRVFENWYQQDKAIIERIIRNSNYNINGW